MSSVEPRNYTHAADSTSAMVTHTKNGSAPVENRATSARASDRELVVTCTFDATVPLVFAAWTTPAQFSQWWVPKSSGATLLSCAQDVRIGGGYRLEFAHPQAATPVAFFGTYLDVVPNARLVWTNEESADGAVTTVTFDNKDGTTLLVMRELYPSKQALEAAVDGMCDAMSETFTQLDEFLIARGADTERAHVTR